MLNSVLAPTDYRAFIEGLGERLSKLENWYVSDDDPEWISDGTIFLSIPEGFRSDGLVHLRCPWFNFIVQFQEHSGLFHHLIDALYVVKVKEQSHKLITYLGVHQS